MAIDWSKEISFSGLKKSGSKPNNAYPEKTYMNLVVSTKKETDLRKAVPLAIVLLVVVALFAKFGVFDFYDRVNAKQAELNKQQQALSAVNAQLKDYNEVLAEYEGYASISVSKDGLQVDALDALALIDQVVSPSARVTAITLAGNTMTLNITDITLYGIGQLVSTLYSQDMVQDVSVSTAATEQTASEDVAAVLTITLKPMAK